MSSRSLFNKLELAHAPLTAYEFAVVRNDSALEAALDRASLYIIAQRPVISFENIVLSHQGLQFNISQKGTSQVLNCSLPFIQPAFNLSEEGNVGAVFHFMDPYVHNFKMPVDGVRGFSLVQQIEGNEHFVAWFSPEKFLRNWWSQHLDCKIKGDIRPFTRYKVHYVGKATKQNIIKRLTGHSALQDILSLEASVTGMQMPANEIVILPFQFRENVELQSFGR